MPGMQGPYHGVPLVGMPLFAEQPDNIARAIDHGFALSVSVKKLDTLAKDLEHAIRRILKEPSFAVNAARVSHLMKAHREHPAEVAASEHPPLHIFLFVLLKKLFFDHVMLCAVRHSSHLFQGLVTLLT